MLSINDITEEGIIVKAKDGIYRIYKSPDDGCDSSPREDDGNLGTMVCWHRRYNLGDKHDYENPEAFMHDLLRTTVMTPRYFGGPVIKYIENGKAKNIRFDDIGKEHKGCRVIVGKNEDDEDIEENWVYVNDIAWPSDTPADRTWLASQCIDWLTMGEVNEILSAMQVCILPVYLLDHSGLSLSTSDFNDPWDSGQVGYIYTTIDKAKDLWYGDSGEPDPLTWQDRAKKEMSDEVARYSKYIGGEVYGIIIHKFAPASGEFSELDASNDDAFEDVDSCWGFYDNDGLEFIKDELGDVETISDDELGKIVDGCFMGEEGVCPICGSKNLIFDGSIEREETLAFKPFKCADCGASGEEAFVTDEIPDEIVNYTDSLDGYKFDGFCDVTLHSKEEPPQPIKRQAPARDNELLMNKLLAHRGHKVVIVSYGDPDNPEVALECEKCGEVILDAGLYTLAARTDKS